MTLQRNLKIEQGAVLLAAEHVFFPWTSRRPLPPNRKFKGVGGFDNEEVCEPLHGDIEEGRNGLLLDDPAGFHLFEQVAVVENDVKGQVIHPGVFAPDGFGESLECGHSNAFV